MTEQPSNPFENRSWFKKLSAAAEQAQAQAEETSPDPDWNKFLATPPAGGIIPAELPGAQRAGLAQLRSQFLGWQQAGFTEAQAFQLLRDQMQVAYAISMKEQLRREQEGGS